MAVLVAAISVSSVSFARFSQTAKPRPPKIRVSKETTYFTKPLRKDGTVDYAAALNARACRGVTTEKNAVVLIVQVCSREHLTDAVINEYNRELGIAAMATARRRMLTMNEFAKHVAGARHEAYAEALEKEYKRTWNGPWARKELPRMAAWLDHNKEPLAAFESASKRSQWYWPINLAGSKHGLLVEMCNSSMLEMVSVTRALKSRALLAVQESRLDDAMKDLLTCHRLARGVGRGQDSTDAMIAGAIELETCAAAVKMLESRKLNQMQLDQFASELLRLPEMPSRSEKVRLTERCMRLQATQFIARNGLKGLLQFVAFDYRKTVPPANVRAIEKSFGLIDWNVPLKTVNQEFDRIESATRHATFRERTKAVKELEARVYQFREQLWDPKLPSKIRTKLRIDPAKISHKMGALINWQAVMVLPGLTVKMDAEHLARFRLTQIAVALERYRQAHGRFPEKFTTLQPRFLKTIPPDVYTEKPFVYKPHKMGYLIYGLGPNMKDDGGKNEGKADDVSVRVGIK
jgi:hypothetical protein